MTTPRLDLVGIVVSDMAAAIAFYRRLGLEFPDDTEGYGHVEATVGGTRVALDSEETVRSLDPGWDPGGSGRIGLAFVCDSPADVDRLFGELVDEGVEPHREPWDAFWGQRYAQVRDPDGNGIDLFAPLPT
jgi:catechol 2,3-dioxygenase-like lactoylglutathione lyase family enzyme